MSNWMLSQTWNDQSIKVPTTKLVMLALADCHNPKKGCFPSTKKLMRMTGLSERGVQQAIAQLVKTRKLQKTSGGGRGNKNVYRLYYPEQPENQKAASHEAPIVTHEMISEMQKQYPELDLTKLFLPAKEACAKKYPKGGAMRREFFEEYIANELKKRSQADPPTGDNGRAANIVPFAANGSSPSTPPMDENTRGQFIATLHARCPQVNVYGMAERFEAERAGKPWDKEEFRRRVAQAEADFTKSCQDS